MRVIRREWSVEEENDDEGILQVKRDRRGRNKGRKTMYTSFTFMFNTR